MWARSASWTALLISLVGQAAPSFAQPYPQRPVRVIVNVSAGGGVDMTARTLAVHFGSVFKQPFIVDYRTGAVGSIGIELVTKAPPDGHTLLACSSGIVTNAAFRPLAMLSDHDEDCRALQGRERGLSCRR